MALPEKQTDHEGRFLRLCRRGQWEFVERVNASGVVVIVPVTADRRVIFVEQVRVPFERPVIEFPAGLVGDLAGQTDEALETAAARELEEETGYVPGRLTWICAGPPSSGLTTEFITLFLATELRQTGPGGGDEHERITVHTPTLAETPRWLTAQAQRGALVDPKVYTGLYFIEHLLPAAGAARCPSGAVDTSQG